MNRDPRRNGNAPWQGGVRGAAVGSSLFPGNDLTLPHPADPVQEKCSRVGNASGRPDFAVLLRAEPDVADPIKALKSGLKRLLRGYGLRCLDVREVRQ